MLIAVLAMGLFGRISLFRVRAVARAVAGRSPDRLQRPRVHGE